jgi:hypothetical protein
MFTEAPGIVVPPGYIRLFHQEHTMAKGDQKSNKMAKKPKKDTSLPPETAGTSSRPVAPMTAVLPKGKLKNK